MNKEGRIAFYYLFTIFDNQLSPMKRKTKLCYEKNFVNNTNSFTILPV